MALNDNAVRVGVTGHVFAAPVGTPLPVTVTATLNAAFDEVGLMTTDGLSENYAVTKELLKAWQRPAGVRTITTEVSWKWKFQAFETSYLTLGLYYPGATTTSDGTTAITSIPAVPGETSLAWVIQIEDGDVLTRYAIAKGDITERGEVAHKYTDGTFYEMTVSVLGTSLDDLGTRYTNDPTLVTTPS